MGVGADVVGVEKQQAEFGESRERCGEIAPTAIDEAVHVDTELKVGPVELADCVFELSERCPVVPAALVGDVRILGVGDQANRVFPFLPVRL